MHPHPFTDEVDRVRSPPMFRQSYPFKKWRYRGCRASRFFSKLRKQADEGFKPFVKDLPFTNSMERNHDFDLKNFRSGKISKGFHRKRSWRPSGGSPRSYPVAKKPRWYPPPRTYNPPPSSYQGEKFIPYKPSQSPHQVQTYMELPFVQNTGEGPLVENPGMLTNSKSWYLTSSTVTSIQKSWPADNKDMIQMPSESTNLEQLSVHNRGTSTHQEQTIVLNSSVSSYVKQSLIYEDRVMVQKLGPPCDKVHKMQISGASADQKRFISTPYEHKLVKKSSRPMHQEHYSKMPTLVQQAVVQKSDPPTDNEHRGLTLLAPEVSSSSPRNHIVEQKWGVDDHDLEHWAGQNLAAPLSHHHPVVKELGSTCKQSAQVKGPAPSFHKEAFLDQESGMLKQHFVQKKSATALLECVAALETGSLTSKKNQMRNSGPSTKQEPRIQSRENITGRRPDPQKKGLLQRHAADKKTSVRSGEDAPGRKLDAPKNGVVQGRATGQKASIHIHPDVLGQRSDTQKKSQVQGHATGQKPRIQIHQDVPGQRSDTEKRSHVHAQAAAGREIRIKSGRPDTQKNGLTQEKPKGEKKTMQIGKDAMRGRAEPPNKGLIQEHGIGGKTSFQNHEDITGGKSDAQKNGLVQGSAAPSCKETASVQQSAPTTHETPRVPAMHQESVPIHRDQPPLPKSKALIHPGDDTVQKSLASPRKKHAMQNPIASADHKPPEVQKACRGGESSDQQHSPLPGQNVSTPKEHSDFQSSHNGQDVVQRSISPERIQVRSSGAMSCLENDVDQNSDKSIHDDIVRMSGGEGSEDQGEQHVASNLVVIPLLKLLEIIFEDAPEGKTQETVCLACGDVGYFELLIFCSNCKMFAVHRYCMGGFVAMEEEEPIFICDDCVGRYPELDSLNDHQGKKTPRQRRSSSSANSREKTPQDFDCFSYGEIQVGGSSNLYEVALKDENNHNSPIPSEGGWDGSEMQQRIRSNLNEVAELKGGSVPLRGIGDDCSNGDIHVRKRRRRLVIYESDDDLSQSPDTSKESHDYSFSMCDKASESYSSMTARLIFEPVWRGWFQISSHQYGMFSGHLSNKACVRVLEGVKLLKPVNVVEMLPRIDAWPKRFERSPPTDDNIGLFLFPEKFWDEKMFDKLVYEVNSRNLALKVSLEEMELLLFSSLLLPQNNTRFCGKYYLWGVFRARQVLASNLNVERTIPNREDSLNVMNHQRSKINILGDPIKGGNGRERSGVKRSRSILRFRKSQSWANSGAKLVLK